MKKGVEGLAEKLLSMIYTTTELKRISVALESLSESNSFKAHAQMIASDSKLSDPIKKTQLLYLVKDLEIPVLYEFFKDLFSDHEFWLFSSKQFDYFDEFVRAFQLMTEKIILVNLVTAIEVDPDDLTDMAKDLTKSFGTQTVIHLQINPAIIGGAQIRIKNLVFDYSLRSKFHQFQRQWISRMEKTSELVGR